MRIEKVSNGEHKVVDKTWGHEVWVENIVEYCGKVLHVKRDGHTSLHFHMNKKETMYCARGSFEIKLWDPANGDKYSVVLKHGDSLLIPPGQPHEIHGIEDENILIEFSTHHEDEDSYRVGKPSK